MAKRKESRTWSRKPIPVETLISCLTPKAFPGYESRFIDTSILVSLVTRWICAVRGFAIDQGFVEGGGWKEEGFKL